MTSDILRFISLTSGSCGNCSLLLYDCGDRRTGILIDAGVSLRKMKKVLESESLSFEDISCVLVTHDHMDHIRHLGAFCKKLRIPVYAPAVLYRALLRNMFTGEYFRPCAKVLPEGAWMPLSPDVNVRFFEVPHDATQTVGYAISLGDRKFVLMTDLGRMTPEAVSLASGADTVVIESNYDVGMLLGGDYPYELKMRICKGAGHLSNGECAEAVTRIMHPGLKNLFLCHLSAENNTPELAYRTTLEALEGIGVGKGEINLRVLPRGEATALMTL